MSEQNITNIEEKTMRGSPDRFGYEWARYSEVLPESKEQLKRWLGSVGLETFANKRVMDVGCGMGRNPYWYNKAGAKEILAVDVNEDSLAAARENLKQFKNIEVHKCSAYELDSENFGKFDRVTCIGVLHHLDDPELALDKMWSMVAPGGDLVVWCYGKEGNELLLPVIHAMKFFGSRLPLPIVRMSAKLTTYFAWPAIHFIPWRTNYYKNLKKLSFRNVESIVFDQMLPHIAHYWTEEDMKRLADRFNSEYKVEQVQGNSWMMRISAKP